MDMIYTLVVGGIGLLLAALAFMAEAIIWRIPPYSRFKDWVEKLEHATVTRVSTPYEDGHLTLSKISRRRVHEILHTYEPVPDAVTIGQCFGAFFFRDESLSETVLGVKVNASIVLFFAIFGAATVLIQSPTLGQNIQHADVWARVPMLITAIFEEHLLMMLEIVAILTGLLYLIHNTRLVSRMVKTFEAE